MNNGDVIEQIRRRVSESALGKVCRSFNGRDPDVIHEWLQNARRAGATHVDMTIADGFMTIADDGVGISKPASLLGFGESDWSDASVQDEDPAGIGVFSLARRAATVTSRTEGGQPWSPRTQPPGMIGYYVSIIRSAQQRGPGAEGPAHAGGAADSHEGHPGGAKRKGRQVELGPHWMVKIGAMADVLASKFALGRRRRDRW